MMPCSLLARRWSGIALGCALVLASGTARSDSADELARKHFESGAAYLEQSDYESALREFNAAYELSKRSEILLNVATVHERTGKLNDAVAALERYLEVDPEGEHAESVRIRIENIKKRIAETPPETRPAEEPPPAPAPAPAAAAQPTPPPATVPKADASQTPAIILFSAAGALAVGSVVTGILAQGKHSDAETTCSPYCTDDQLASGRALAVTSTVLTGAAVVAAAVGAVFFFGSASDEHADNRHPAVGLNLTPHGASANARWRF